MANLSGITVVGVFRDQSDAQAVVEDLASAGIPRSEIHQNSRSDYATDAATGGAALTGTEPQPHHGGFMGWLERLFGADDETDDRTHYTNAVERGHYVVSVDTDEANRSRVADIMERHNAVDIERQDTGTTDYVGTTPPAQYAGTPPPASYTETTSQSVRGSNPVAGEQAIPVVQEDLQVDKRAVQRGGVRIYTRSQEQPVEEQVTLRDEHVSVDRRPVNRPVTSADQQMLRDQTIEVTEMTEEPVIKKTARVVEEVVIGKEATERTQTVRDTVRKQQVEVEQIDAQRGTSQRGVDDYTRTAGDYRSTGSDYGSTGGDYGDDYRRDFETRYAGSGESYQTYAPAYGYGQRMAGDPAYKGRTFEDVEDTLKTDYLRNNPNSSWDRMKGAVRYGWERMSGKR